VSPRRPGPLVVRLALPVRLTVCSAACRRSRVQVAGLVHRFDSTRLRAVVPSAVVTESRTDGSLSQAARPRPARASLRRQAAQTSTWSSWSSSFERRPGATDLSPRRPGYTSAPGVMRHRCVTPPRAGGDVGGRLSQTRGCYTLRCRRASGPAAVWRAGGPGAKDSEEWRMRCWQRCTPCSSSRCPGGTRDRASSGRPYADAMISPPGEAGIRLRAQRQRGPQYGESTS